MATTAGQSPGERCGVCYESPEDCCDGLCGECEEEYMKSIAHLAVIMPRDTNIKDLFAAAGNVTRARLLWRRKQTSKDNKTLRSSQYTNSFTMNRIVGSTEEN